MQDLFNSSEFKNLPFMQRVWIRIKIAFFETINMT
jgi:hypothetical protein